MIHTTFICGLGLLVFAFSDFIPTQRFAWMMLALLTTALIGDLLFLPAMLVQPFVKHLQFARDRFPKGMEIRATTYSTE